MFNMFQLRSNCLENLTKTNLIGLSEDSISRFKYNVTGNCQIIKIK